jgi:NifU-like protein involved in Fe-S cluster formation
MDEAVIKFYRRLLKEDFPNAGTLDNPSVFVEAVGEKLINCGNTGNYMQIYLQVDDQRIVDIKYLCSCEPVANVAVEIMCSLLKGKTLDEATGFKEEPFYQFLGCQDEGLRKKVQGLLELLNEGVARYQGTAPKDSDEQGEKLSWDGTLSR